MGNKSSFTVKASIPACFFTITKWGPAEMKEFLKRGQDELPETFALRRNEFEFLMGRDLVDFNSTRAMFNDIFDTDKNSMVDKFEVMCVVCLISLLSNEEKLYFFFNLFNFNNKGFLYESEITILFLAISRGVYKVDHSFIPPPTRAISTLVAQAMIYAKYDKSYLRKPELAQFVLENRELTAFLSSWKGHSAQVLLGENEKWRDLSFPCNDTSICPSREWLAMGLPPDGFVKWRRPEKVGTELGCIYLFAHKVGFLKTIDRRRTFSGPGAIGTGSLQQGMLADRWLLNAMACTIANPDIINQSFAQTGQEEQGRYCVRFFEGGKWRSIFVDDRVPCGPDCNPLFAFSSCRQESWPIIIEKATAKYFGSYGSVGMFSKRPDAMKTALRMLTGGHVYKLPTKKFDWRSVDDDVKGENGSLFIRSLLKEGSIVAFGRSESKTMMRQKDISGDSMLKLVVPPHGRLFPYVGSVYVKGFNHCLLRDAWGLIDDCTSSVDTVSGHCKTFQIRIEDIPELYDTIVVSRFPDSFRSTAESRNVLSWNTKIIKQQTHGIRQPAMFKLRVLSRSAELHKKVKDSQVWKRYKAPDADKVLKLSDRKGAELLNNDVQVRLKDPLALARRKSRAEIKKEQEVAALIEADNAVRLAQKLEEEAEQLREEQEAQARMQGRRMSGERRGSGAAPNRMRAESHESNATSATNVTNASGTSDGGGSGHHSNANSSSANPAHEATLLAKAELEKQLFLVDIALTYSTSLDWSIAGGQILQSPHTSTKKSVYSSFSKMRVRIVPSASTYEKWESREKAMEAEEKRKAEELAERKRKQEYLIAVVEEGDTGSEMNDASNRNRAQSMHSHSSRPLSSSRRASKSDVQQNPRRKSNTPEEVNTSRTDGSQQQTQKNDNDVDEEAAEAERKAAELKHKQRFDVVLSGERSWMSHSVSLLPGVYYVFVDVDLALPYREAFQMSLPRDGSTAETPWLESAKAPINSFSKTGAQAGPVTVSAGLGEESTIGTYNHDGDDSSGEGGGHTAHSNATTTVNGEQATIMSKRGTVDTGDITQDHHVWLQASTIDDFALLPLDHEEAGLNLSKRGLPPHPLLGIDVTSEKWPFFGECQSETSSRKLVDMLTNYRIDAQKIGVEFMTLARRYKEEHKKMIMQEQVPLGK